MKLITKSPIHIGNGNELGRFEYIYDKSYINIIDFNKLISLIPQEYIDNFISDIENQTPLNLLLKRYKIDINKVVKCKLLVNSENFQHKDIKEFIKTGQKPYIPGSEIKGAIRTAILYKILKDDWDYFKNEFTYQNKKGFLSVKTDKKLSKNLEEKVFGNTQNDIMKFFRVGDTDLIDIDNLQIEAIKIVNSSKKFTEYTECLKEGVNLETNIKIFKDNPNFKKAKYKSYLINWKNAVYEYSQDIIKVEKDYWENKNKNVVNQLEKLQKENAKESPLLRIGRYTGKLSHTIVTLLKIKQLEENLKVDFKIFPKTRRITDTKKLLGWIRLDENNISENLDKDSLKRILSKKFKVR